MILPNQDTYEQVRALLPRLSSPDKLRLLREVARELGDGLPGIEHTPGVCGGEACIVRTRIPVWLLEEMRRRGATEAELLEAYPALRAEDLSNAWAYVAAHREQIDELINRNEAA